MASTDEQLVVQAQAGDRQAFDALVSKHRSRVYYLALSMLGCRDTAMDIAQDAFVQAYLSLRALRSPEKFASWLTAITRNLCLMHLRRSRETAMPEEYLQPVVRQESESEVMPILDTLPEGTRSAALLYFVEEMKQAEIAEFLGISLSAVKSRIRDARSRLRKEMIDMVKRTAKEPGDEFNKSLQHKLELARWYREMADMLTSGIPVLQTFEMLAAGDFSEPIKEASLIIRAAAKAGKLISETIGELPAVNTVQAVSMTRAGEVGGILDWTAGMLADWIEVESGQRELELAFWCRTFGSVIAAGAPMKLAFESTSGVIRDAALKRASNALAQALESDSPLDLVLSQHADVFMPVVQVSILAGKKADMLGYALQWAANAVHARMAERLIGNRFQPPVRKAPWFEQDAEAFARAVCEYLDSESPSTRAAAATIIGRLGLADRVTLVLPLLSDTDMAVRKAAIQALADSAFPGAAAELAKSLNDAEQSVRRAAINAIVEIDLHALAAPVARLIADTDQRVADTAIKALEAMEEIGVLTGRAIELLPHERSICRIRAVQTLLAHPDPAAADALVKALDDEVHSVYFNAALALARLGRREAVPILRKARDSGEAGYVQRTAAKALEEMGS